MPVIEPKSSDDAEATPPAKLTVALSEKLTRLRRAASECESALVCFSGGVDSMLLLRVVHDVLGERCVAMTAVSETMAGSERRGAVELAKLVGCRHEVIESHEMQRPGFAENPTDRCYHCKAELMDLAQPLAARLGLATVLLGTNRDDLGDHRPGLSAANERGARHPLLEAELDKSEVRALSRALGLPTWDKPQLACLSSRFPYGTAITPARLHQVDAFEDALRELGFRQLRVRYHGAIARLELDPAEMHRAMAPEVRAHIVAQGRRLGFTFVALDLAGFASGSLNQLVGLKPRPANRA